MDLRVAKANGTSATLAKALGREALAPHTPCLVKLGITRSCHRGRHDGVGRRGGGSEMKIVIDLAARGWRQKTVATAKAHQAKIEVGHQTIWFSDRLA